MRAFAILGTLALSLLWGCDTPTATNSPAGAPATVLPVPVASLVGAPSLNNATFFGGSGDQLGNGIAIVGASAYVSGYDQGGGPDAILVKFTLPAVLPVWNAMLANTYFLGITANSTTAYPVGAAIPPACGASDGVGDTESKSLVARYGTGGGSLGCGSTNFFPYRGGEYYFAALTLVESGTPFVYAAGRAEQTGFGASFPFVLVKHDAGGTIINQVTEPGITLGSFSGCCPGESSVNGIAEHGGDLYLAGHSRLPGFVEDNVNRPVLMRYSPALARVWKARPTDNAGGFFHGVAAFGGNLYAAGHNGFGAGADYLIEKYSQTGTRIWTATSGGGAEDVLTGVVGVGSRLFAVGYTRGSGAGGADAVILEIDPATGATISTSLFGGAEDDLANGTATDGADLYVVGQSRSFASAEGNVVGQNDVMLLRYTLTLAVDIDIKPGSDPDSINTKSKGKIPVAILSSADLDAPATVDPSSLTFGHSGDEPSLAFCNTGGEDVNGDARLDLMCHFFTQKTGFQAGDTEGILRGQTTGGQPIEGRDAVIIVS